MQDTPEVSPILSVYSTVQIPSSYGFEDDVSGGKRRLVPIAALEDIDQLELEQLEALLFVVMAQLILVIGSSRVDLAFFCEQNRVTIA